MATPAAKRDQHSAQMLAIVRELLRELGSHQAAKTVTIDSSLERDLGLGSLERVELLVRAEKRYGCRLPDEIAQRGETPAEWIEALANGGQIQTTPGRFPIEPSGEAPPPPAESKTFAEVLRAQTEAEPGRIQIHLLEGDAGQTITSSQLLERSQQVAAGLIETGLQRNETVAIMLPTCEDFFYAFLGTMLAGGIAVPIYPPARPDKIEEYVRRQVKILANAEVRFLISFERVRAVSQVMRLSLPALREVTTVSALRQRGMGAPGPSVQPADSYFIQYTSGSTGNPKGVVLTHSNVLANVKGIGWAVQARPDDVVVTWLPLYHDMGLIGSWLFSLYHGFPITVLSPLAFLSRPERWLWALSDSRGTLCPAPNFSYELCARKITDDALEGVDLSRWRVAINAGEAVLPATLERFASRFKPWGFRPESYIPCYGLAESSVALTFPPINRRPVIDSIRRDVFEKEGRAVPAEAGDENVLQFVANGRALPEHEIRVADGNGKDLPERLRGRILFRGPSKTAGYFRNPEATSAVTSADGWMDSGDLGYRAKGEVYITGREKEIIIKGGHNISPQEIEGAAAEVSGVRRGCVAAFGISDPDSGTERLIVVAETRTRERADLSRIKAEVIKIVGKQAGTPPDQVELVPPQTIPKTSSGKIRRNETRKLYEAGELVRRVRPPWMQIARLWAENAGGWVRLAGNAAGSKFLQVCRASATLKTAIVFGLLARLMPTRQAASRIARSGARLILALNGRKFRLSSNGQLDGARPFVMIANRPSWADLLTLVAALPPPVLLAEERELSNLPLGAAFLLEPLVIPPVEATAAMSEGAFEHRVGQALREGESLLVLAESAPGTPVERNRYRLEPIRAASEASAGIVPVRIAGGGWRLNGGSPGGSPAQASITLGAAIRTAPGDLDGITGLRDQIRQTIAAL